MSAARQAFLTWCLVCDFLSEADLCRYFKGLSIRPSGLGRAGRAVVYEIVPCSYLDLSPVQHGLAERLQLQEVAYSAKA